jgi:tetratricopeptide (TPR) repeat protein
LETKPSGATVESGDGHSWGVTPLHLVGLRPGQWEFVLRRDGYESAHVSLDVAGNQTNSFSTNLVSTSYVRAMESARQYLKRADYKRALESSSEALVANPSDPEAAAIQGEATKQGTLFRAKALAAKGDYDGATGELEVALLTVPEDGELKQLLTDYRKRKEERAERQRQEQTSHATVIFKAMLGNNKDAGLFDHHELKSRKPFGEVESAIRTALQNERPTFTVNELKSPESDVFILEAKEQLPSGMRQCLIVGGQTLPDETQIFYEVLEYTTGQNVSVLGVLNVKTDFILTPIHPSRVEQMTNALQNQVSEGILIITRLMVRASE